MTTTSDGLGQEWVLSGCADAESERRMCLLFHSVTDLPLANRPIYKSLAPARHISYNCYKIRSDWAIENQYK